MMDEEADFDAFVRARAPSLLRGAWLLVGEWPAAEDLVQAALERAWPKWSQLAGEAGQTAYVRRIVLTLFLRGRRRRWSGEVATEEPPDRVTIDESDSVVVRADVVSALRRLPSRQRAVIALRYFDDLTEAQTAAVMRCAQGTVKRYTARALATLRADPVVAGLFDQEMKS